ncbi:MAG: DNA repair exonuclease [Clostridia bacterium]|nr:DNA repair exonuclease [Clostridia bacterium]
MPSFIHTADIHLDTPFHARFTPEEAMLRRKEVMQTFERICQEAKQKDLLLIAGDLVNGRFLSGEIVAFLQRCFSSIPDTQVILVAGNHDPMTDESCFLTQTWGDNVHIFGREMEYIDFPLLKTRIHGRSFSSQHQEETLLTPLTLEKDWCNILVMHGDVVSDGGESAYNPIEKSALAQSGVDYAALGHIHLSGGLNRAGTVYYAYPGIPEGRGFSEEGLRGYFAGTVEKGFVDATWIPVCKRQFLAEQVDLFNCRDSIEAVHCARQLIESKGHEHCYRITFTGNISFIMPQTSVLCEQLKDDCFSLEVIDETRPAYDLEELRKENTLRGAFVQEMLNEISRMPEAERARGELALMYGLEAMERGRLS